MHVLGIAASPSSTSRTRLVLDAVLDEACGHAGVTASVVTFADRVLPPADGTHAEDQMGDARELLVAVDEADAVVFGMPVYRGSVPGSLKNFLDLVPRGGHEGEAQSLRAKPVAIVATGASDHHFLAIDDLAAILRGFFEAHVVPPGVYASADSFEGEALRCPRVRRTAVQTGSALVELQRGIASSRSLSKIEPLL